MMNMCWHFWEHKPCREREREIVREKSNSQSIIFNKKGFGCKFKINVFRHSLLEVKVVVVVVLWKGDKYKIPQRAKGWSVMQKKEERKWIR